MRRERNEDFRDGGFRGGGGRGMRQSFAPVKVGDEVEVKIEGVGGKGDGIAKVNGFVIFVPGTKQGDTVKVKITKVFRKVGFGEVIGASEGGESQTEETMETEEQPAEESQENIEE